MLELGKLYTRELGDYLAQNGFYTAPASRNWHGNYEGGLFDHSKMVALNLRKLSNRNNLSWGRYESPFIVGMFHDLCKIDEYVKNKEGEYVHNSLKQLGGHGDKSVILLSKFIDLTEEEKMCIRWHMGAYEGNQVWGHLSEAIKGYPNILWTILADTQAAYVEGV